jgi:hypothetical protein
MVGMGMGKQHGIDTIDAAGQRLDPELGRGVDQNIFVAKGNQNRRAVAFVFGIVRSANPTATTDHGNPDRCAGSQKGNLHQADLF